MKRSLNQAILAVVAATLLPAALAQNSAPKAKPDPSTQDPYAGVSQPPSNETIETTPDAPPATPPPAVAPARTPDVTPTTPAPVQKPYASTSVAPSSRTADPDADIVTGAAPDEAAPRSSSPRLHTRRAERGNGTDTMIASRSSSAMRSGSVDPDADIVTAVPGSENELPEGTNLHVTLSQTLSTEETRPGSHFSGRISKQVTLGGRVMIPEGSEFHGRVVQVSEGHRLGNRATIRLEPESVVLPDGAKYTLHAQVIASHGNNTRVDDEGGIHPGTHMKKAAVEAGIGAGTGAVAGGAIAGGPGALVGSLVGVGVVTTHLLIQPPQTVNVPSDTSIVFSLTRPLELTPVHD